MIHNTSTHDSLSILSGEFNERIKAAIDNELGMKVVNAFGRWVYIIKVDKD